MLFILIPPHKHACLLLFISSYSSGAQKGSACSILCRRPETLQMDTLLWCKRGTYVHIPLYTTHCTCSKIKKKGNLNCSVATSVLPRDATFWFLWRGKKYTRNTGWGRVSLLYKSCVQIRIAEGKYQLEHLGVCMVVGTSITLELRQSNPKRDGEYAMSVCGHSCVQASSFLLLCLLLG